MLIISVKSDLREFPEYSEVRDDHYTYLEEEPFSLLVRAAPE